jgi:hypothetical protein
VNVADLADLAGNFGQTAGMTLIKGDFDYNGNVNVADLADLAGNFGKTLAAGSSTSSTEAPTAPAAKVVQSSPFADLISQQSDDRERDLLKMVGLE